MSAAAPESVQLRDGSTALIRPIRPSDKDALVEGFAHLSDESRYKRFLAPVNELRPRQLRYFTEIDHHDHEALVGQSPEGEPLGVARYVRVGAHTAEAAVAVVDHWQGRGLGTALLQRLAGRAREEGIERFTAVLLASNREMLTLLQELGATQMQGAEDGVIEVRVELPLEVEPEAPLRRALRSAASGQVQAAPPVLDAGPEADEPG